MTLEDSIRSFWDADAPTYDRSPDHGVSTPSERAAWSAALSKLLPDNANVLDTGAGTGFLTLIAARLGHRVTALDLSAGMLERLRANAEAEHLDVTILEGSADHPPAGPFNAVIERHLIWTLPDPAAALAAWRRVAPAGRLVLFEGLWGGADPVEATRQRLRAQADRLRKRPPHHHAEYGEDVQAALPLAGGAHPDRLVELVEAAGWGPARLERLRDVEWATLLGKPPADRALGVTPRFAIVAG